MELLEILAPDPRAFGAPTRPYAPASQEDSHRPAFLVAFGAAVVVAVLVVASLPGDRVRAPFAPKPFDGVAAPIRTEQAGRPAAQPTDADLPYSLSVSPTTATKSQRIQVHLSGNLSGVAPGPMVLYVDALVDDAWRTEYWLTGSVSADGPFGSGTVSGQGPVPPPGEAVGVEGTQHRAYFVIAMPSGIYRVCRRGDNVSTGARTYLCAPLTVIETG